MIRAFDPVWRVLESNFGVIDAPDLAKPCDEPHLTDAAGAASDDGSPVGSQGSLGGERTTAHPVVGGLPAGDNGVRHPAVRARFWSKVDKSGECWLWTSATRSGKGERYGRFSLNGHAVSAHRFAWEIERGPIPAGLSVLHRCDTPLCVRPDHLFLGTHTDNMRDMAAKGRGVHPPGFVPKPQERCPRGHSLDGRNGRRDPRFPNARSCRACQAAAHQARKARRLAAASTEEGR